jgi:hypothetical protein
MVLVSYKQDENLRKRMNTIDCSPKVRAMSTSCFLHGGISWAYSSGSVEGFSVLVEAVG